MGSQKSKIQPNFNFRSSIHSQLKNSTIIRIDEELLLQKIQLIYDEQQYENWSKQKDKNLAVIDFRFLYLPIAIDNQKNNYCSGTMSTKIYYEFYPFCLDKQILFRRKSSLNPATIKYFKQTQIAYLLFTGLFSLSQFQKLNKKIGLINPSNIVLNQKGKLKYVNKYSWPSESRRLIRNQQSNTFYLAPQQFENNEYLNIKSQCFSFGMIVMQSILLKPIKDIYGSAFNLIKFQEYITQLKNSPIQRFLIKIILMMIQINFKKRPSASYLFNLLKPYQNQILDFKWIKFTNI